MNSNLKNKTKQKNKQSKTDEDTKRLLEYYRLRMEGINLDNENFHQKEWELNKLNEKIIELQQSLSQSNIALNNERRRIISFNSEIDTFKSN